MRSGSWSEPFMQHVVVDDDAEEEEADDDDGKP